jgi:ADP-L-glycero-D-manno-heptose 6-epimerase
MIVVTGAAGFIPSCLIGKLNAEGYKAIVASDDFSRQDKVPNLEGKQILRKIDRKEFPAWLKEHGLEVEFVFHLGARTDTTEKSVDIFNELNLNYSKTIWEICSTFQIPLVYASSAATYGNGEMGYSDDHGLIPGLKPLNPYAQSKQDFDLWVLKQEHSPFFWAGLKFFNVYGPNEYHKGKMASVIFHAFQQIKKEGKMRLFQSHKAGVEHGHQMRDFVYVKDVVAVCFWLMHHRKDSGIYNLGSGRARTFLDLAHATFSAMDLQPDIEFIPTPESIREGYQYFTEADMSKLKSIGYPLPFTSLENGVLEYVGNYLITGRYF